MRSPDEVEAVLALVASGHGDCEVARRTGVPRTTVRTWRLGGLPLRPSPDCPSCGHSAHRFSGLPVEYVYLLGMYLGDGHVSRHRKGVFRLTIGLDVKYPAIIEECRQSMARVMPTNRVNVHWRPRGEGFAEVSAYSRQWPCLLPQHGTGHKHQRLIELTGWQRKLVERDPGLLLRGLIHSDGCRSANRVVVRGRAYSYPRYTFSNTSEDIRRIFTAACDQLGVRWRQMNATNVSIARRESVARLDELVGVKA